MKLPDATSASAAGASLPRTTSTSSLGRAPALSMGGVVEGGPAVVGGALTRTQSALQRALALAQAQAQQTQPDKEKDKDKDEPEPKRSSFSLRRTRAGTASSSVTLGGSPSAAAGTTTTTTTTTATLPTKTLIKELLSLSSALPNVRESKVAELYDAAPPSFTSMDFDNKSCSEDELQVLAVRLLDWACACAPTDSPFANKPGLKLLWVFVESIRATYKPLPYHNFRHGVDVAQMMCAALARPDVGARVPSPLDRFCLVAACLLHDAGHVGASNAHLRATNDPILQAHASLEHYHAFLAAGILDRSTAVLERAGLTTPAARTDFAEAVRRLILATNPDEHDDAVAELSNRTLNGSPLILHAGLIRMCDISNVCRPFDEARSWTQRLLAEFRLWQGASAPTEPGRVATWFSQHKGLPLADAFAHAGLPAFAGELRLRVERNLATWNQLEVRERSRSRAASSSGAS